MPPGRPAFPRPDPLRGAKSTDNVPRREHSATLEAPGLARRSSGAEPAFRRPGSACPPGRKHPGARAQSRPSRQPPGLLTPRASRSPLPAGLRCLAPAQSGHLRASSERRGPSGPIAHRPALARRTARLFLPIGCLPGMGPTHWRAFPISRLKAGPKHLTDPNAPSWVCTSCPSRGGPWVPSTFSLFNFLSRGARCSLQHPIPALFQTLPTLNSRVAFDFSPRQISEGLSREWLWQC